VSTIEDLSNRSAQINLNLRELLARDQYPADDKTAWVTASLDLALEHQKAILLLIKSELFGSAFAMVRLVCDTALRALWISDVATSDQIEQARDDKLDWRKIGLLGEVEQHCFGEKTSSRDELFRILREAWPAMCNYTHSGALQIGRRFTNGDVKPNYEEGAISEVINVTTTWVLVLSRKFFISMGDNASANETLQLLKYYSAVASPRKGR